MTPDADNKSTLERAKDQWSVLWDTFQMKMDTNVETIKLEGEDTLVPPDLLQSRELGVLVSQLPQLTASRQNDGELRITATLGKGGMGVVYLARQTTIGRDVAVKTIREDRRSTSASRELLREAWITGRLEHPNIIPVHSLGLGEEGQPLLVMKRVEGVSWADALEDASCLPEIFRRDDPLEASLDILDDVCKAVHFAHSRQILHRDIKPDNVMLGPFGEVYLVDWGIAVSLADEVDEDAGRLPLAKDAKQPAGTPAFMAPEMAAGDAHLLGPRSDVYLLGALLHMLLVGEPRHQGKDLYAIMFAAFCSVPFDYDDRVPRELAEICNRATHVDPARRFESAEQFRQALLEFRRHHSSRQIVRDLEATVGELEALAGAGGFSIEEVSRAHGIFGTCRFGYEQALQIWSENTLATRGLGRAMRAMLRIELEVGNLAEVDALLEQNLGGALDEKEDRELLERIERLRQQKMYESRQIEALEAANARRDPRVDRRQRGISMVTLAMTLALVNILPLVLSHVGVLALGDWGMFYFKLVDLAISMVVLAVILAKVNLNDFGRKVIYALGFLLTAGVALRFGGLIQGMTTVQTVVFESIFYAFFTMGVGLFSDRRLLMLGPFCLLSAIGTLLIPDYSWFVRFSVNLILLGSIGVLWTLHGGDAVGGDDADASRT